MGRFNSHHPREKLGRAERDALIIRLRGAAQSIAATAKAAGCSEATVLRVCNKRMAELAKLTAEGARKMRLIQLDQLQGVKQAMGRKMLTGDVAAASVFIRALQHEAQVWGLNAPPNIGDAAAFASTSALLQLLSDNLSPDTMKEIADVLNRAAQEEVTDAEPQE